MTDMARAYLAGMIDADGCITLSRRKVTRKAGVRHEYVPTVLITNTHIGALDSIVAMAGGGGSVYAGQDVRDGWNRVARAYWRSDKARILIAEVRPFLLMKFRQADLVLALRPMPKTLGMSERPAFFAAQDVIWDELHALNARGSGSTKDLSFIPDLHPSYDWRGGE